MRWTTGWTLALLAAAPLGAQERRVEELDLPRNVAEDVVAFFNRPTTIRFTGRAEIPPGRTIQGDVGVLGGPVRVSGEIQGDVVVVNGDLVVFPGGRITGDATVIGGVLTAGADAVLGQLTVYAEPLTYRRRGESIAYDERPWSQWSERRRMGQSYFSVRNEGSYNRVEGLPVRFGPVFRTQGDDYFRAEALGIWRSESGIRLVPDELGYFLRAEQHFGPRGRLSVGGTAHSVVEPVESAGLRDIEASLAAFFLHRDFRDYYDRRGFSGFLRYEDPEAGVRLTAEYRDDEHSFVPVGSPWTLKRNDGPWRPQPLVAEGRLRSVQGDLVVDDRDDPDDPSDGWYLEARGTVGVGGGLTLPAYYQAPPAPATAASPAREVDTDFQAGLLDLRRYMRLGPGADLRVRGFVAGSLDGASLPPQYQRALGGEGTLPGFPLLSVDCGARLREYSVFRSLDGEADSRLPAYAGYGCDRVALFQAEYRGTLSFRMDLWGDSDGRDDRSWYPMMDLTPSWSVFFDAGRGWSLSDLGAPGHLGSDSDTMMDLGAGFFLGDIGLYVAWPLNGEDRHANFFLRIAHRF